jgi:antitoxin component YwqK of YwqJK toxin-antitoxin module
MFLQKFLLSALLLFTGTHAFCQDAIPLINSSVLIEEGIKLHEEGKYREAIEVYSRISPSDSNYVFSLYEQALSYKADSQFEKSLRVTEHALTVNQEHRHRPLLLSIQGSLVDNMGDRARAIRMYDSAIALYPEFDELYANKAVTYIRADKYAEAEKVMQASLLREPFYPAFHYLNGVSAFYQGKPVEAFLSFASYLLIAPNGTYKSKAISMMSSIAKNDNDIVKLVSERKSEPSDAFLVLEQIIASKIALEKGYKTMISMDDQICRQLQVTMEKLEYNENDGSFYMQYYVPFYTKLFADRKFEPFVYRVFAGVDLDPIQSYIKKNKREIQSVVDRTAEYFSEVRSTRELQAAKRSKSTYRYFFDKNGLSHHGPVNGESFEGKWTYIYPAGNIKAAGQMNRQNEKVGEWRYYYRDGRLDGIENYRDGKLHGAGEYYHENGNLLMRGNYVDGERNGTFTFYDKMGAVSAVETYRNGKVQGVKYSYYPSGVLKATEEFVDNVSTGKFEQFYSNGIKRKSGTTANDELTGPYQYYHEDGTLAIEGAYANGKAIGTWKHYYTNGQLKYTENYVNGVLDGEYTEYHDNGKPATSVHKYKKGKINGPVEFFDNEGIRTSSFSFDDGVIKWAKQFDKTGKQIASSEM